MKKNEEECIKRLELMNMEGNMKNGTCCFNFLSLLSLREVPTKEELRHAFMKIDEKMSEINGTPYMMTLSPSEFGPIVNVFFVSDSESEDWQEVWSDDRESLRSTQEYQGIRYHDMFGYAYNMNCPEFSELGYMGMSEEFERRVY